MLTNFSSLTEHAETAEKGICFTFLPDIAETAPMSGIQSRLILEVSEIRREEKNNSERSNEVDERQAVVLEKDYKNPYS